MLQSRQGLPVGPDETASIEMIFKYCTWPEEAKEADKSTVLRNGESNSIERDQNFNEETGDSRRRNNKIANTVLRYCPCAFRCRQPVDVGGDEEDTVSTIITTVNTTPVIRAMYVFEENIF